MPPIASAADASTLTTAEEGRGNNNAASSPAWIDTARPPTEDGSPPSSSGESSSSSSNDGNSARREESESSWGELQDARVDGGGAAESSDVPGAVGNDETNAEKTEGGAADSEGQKGEGPGPEEGDGDEKKRGGVVPEAELETPPPAAAEGAVVDDGDVVMVSPRGGGSGDGSSASVDFDGATGGVTRHPNLRALMTMLVVSLRMQRLVHWVVRKRCLDGLSANNLVDLLAALEAASVTALKFNRNHNLRRALGRVGFMARGQPVALCPMLEQEVAGYNLLLQTLVVLSRGLDVDSGEPVEGGAGWPFAQACLVQACKCVVLAYADREEHAMGLELTLPGLDHSALVEEVKQTTPLVIFALGSMMYISEEQVRLNVGWMYGCMTRLVRCNSEEVRHHVQQILIYKMGPAMVPQSRAP
ncbi:unnamed protein product [Ectocarpus sp. 13 AM-2016]